jgi:hypothetical protein
MQSGKMNLSQRANILLEVIDMSPDKFIVDRSRNYDWIHYWTRKLIASVVTAIFEAIWLLVAIVVEVLHTTPTKRMNNDRQAIRGRKEKNFMCQCQRWPQQTFLWLAINK